MAENSTISWTKHTFNPWRGCQRVAPECDNCYAATMSKRNPATLGVWTEGDQPGARVVASEQSWNDVLAWNRKAGSGECPACNGGRTMRTHESGYGYEHCQTCKGSRRVAPYRRRVFCASLADVFEDWTGPMHGTGDVILSREYRASRGPAERLTMADVRRRLFALIDATPNLDWLLLTKRPENIRRMWPAERIVDVAASYGGGRAACADLKLRRENVWLGTSAGTQGTADRAIPELIKCRDLSPVLFVSAEPLLGPVRFDAIRDGEWWIDALRGVWEREYSAGVDHPGGIEAVGDGPRLDWIIAGGESGHGRREMNIADVESLSDQCSAAGVPLFVKQDSGPRPGMRGRLSDALWSRKEFPTPC